jgi:DNA-binding NarL/FixJ family response regulator
MMERKPNRNDHPLVCLLSTHPLMLDEFSRKLSRSHCSVKSFRLRQVVFEDVSRLAIPSAKIYVVDGHDPFATVLVGSLVKHFPNARVIVVSEKLSDSTAFQFLELGAKGLLDYSEASMHLSEAVETVAQGGFWVERQLLSRFMDSVVHSARSRPVKTGLLRLTPREREVLECLLANLSNKEIARKLNITERTAKFHVSNLLAKFEVRRRVDLVMLQFHNHRS